LTNIRKTILVCPLDWGLGHASRLVPIIKHLQKNGHRVIIAADRAALSFLKHSFPKLEFIRFPGFVPSYSAGNSQVLHMLGMLPKALWHFNRDHQFVEKLIKEKKIDGLLSDNRFGAWTKQVPSVFITHQLHIRMPKVLKFMQPLVDQFNLHFIKRFNACWIPDNLEQPKLAGDLSFPEFPSVNTTYIGPLSRFSVPATPTKNKDFDVLFLLSGPEPQRSLLEQKIFAQSAESAAKLCMLRGLPHESDKAFWKNKNLFVYNHASDDVFIDLVSRSKIIVARAGYSSIMDLIALEKSAWLIPTPGQTEQLYLAHYLSQKKWFKSIQQDNFNLDIILNTNDSPNSNCSGIYDKSGFHFLDKWTDSL